MAKKVTVIPANPTYYDKGVSREKTRVAAYCRVSTDQEEQLGSFANQVCYYQNLISSRPDWELVDIFADEGISGTGTKMRNGFMEMIKACNDGKIDLVITKSVSRFARNTADSLVYSRKLKDKGIPIIFEKEGINTMDASGELLYTILASLAQEESRNISENTTWGIRSKFQQGIPHINATCVLGYDKDDDGNLIVNEEQATIIRRIYRDFLEGWTPCDIRRRLNVEGVPCLHKDASWQFSTIEHILQNPLHVGDLLMQKTYTADFMTKKQVINNGKLNKYFVKDDHPAIIPRDKWDAVQLEMKRRAEFREHHNVNTRGAVNDVPFYQRVFCARCGGVFIRKYLQNRKAFSWKCQNAELKRHNTCFAENVKEATLQDVIVKAWNALVAERESYVNRWRRTVDEGNALQRYYAHMMISITADGPLEWEVPELTRLILEEMVVHSPWDFEVSFLDGSKVRVVARGFRNNLLMAECI